jgi:uncharacterized protein YidB (DUF937 family)
MSSPQGRPESGLRPPQSAQPTGGMTKPAGSDTTGMVAGGAAAAGSGLDSLLDRLRNAGLGDQVNSWLSDGPNKTIDPQQIQQAVGPQQLSDLAKTAGVSPDQVADSLAKTLPEVVDKMTPHGEMPSSTQIQSTIGRLFGS